LKRALFILFLASVFYHTGSAQLKVDSGYTVFAKGLENKSPEPFLRADPLNMVIKENSTGKTCSPISIQCNFVLQNEFFRTSNMGEVQKYLMRLKPKDKMIIEKIVLPAGCFPPPKQITIDII